MTPTGAVKVGAARAERQVLPLLIHFLFACSRNFDDFESQFEDHSLRSPLVLSSKSLTAPMNFLGLALHVALGTFTEILGLYWIRSGDGSPDSKTKVSCE